MFASLILTMAVATAGVEYTGIVDDGVTKWPVKYDFDNSMLTFQPNVILPTAAYTEEGLTCKVIFWIPSEHGPGQMQVDVIGTLYRGEEDFFSYIWVAPNINPHYGGWYEPANLDPEPDPDPEIP